MNHGQETRKRIKVRSRSGDIVMSQDKESQSGRNKVMSQG